MKKSQIDSKLKPTKNKLLMVKSRAAAIVTSIEQLEKENIASFAGYRSIMIIIQEDMEKLMTNFESAWEVYIKAKEL